MTFAERVLKFNKTLRLNKVLPAGVVTLNPYQDEAAFNLSGQFYKKYYDDQAERTLIIGINPGRFGGGITGVPFTDPIKLQTNCSIENDLPKKTELSADFIYKMIEEYGGPEKFYKKFYITAVSPLGFTKDGKNLNYYDIKELQESLLDFILDCFRIQIAFGVNTDVCYCLGEGNNFKFLSRLNEKYNFFKTIIPLPHPRFIMQYRRKHLGEFIAMYLKKLNA